MAAPFHEIGQGLDSPGAEATFTFVFTRTTAPLSEYAFGSLTWSSGFGGVRSTIALRPVAVAAPAELHSADVPSGSVAFSVTPGYTGTLETSVSGLVGVTPLVDSVTTGAYDIDNPVADADTDVYHVTVPAGTVVARFSLDSAEDTADLDLFVYLNGDLVDLSASGAADEQVTLFAPAAGTYDTYVNGFATPGGSTTYAISNFVVSSADAGNVTVTPDPVAVTIGTPVTLTASWTGLDATKRWLGVISYSDGSVAFGATLLSIR